MSKNVVLSGVQRDLSEGDEKKVGGRVLTPPIYELKVFCLREYQPLSPISYGSSYNSGFANDPYFFLNTFFAILYCFCYKNIYLISKQLN